MQALRQGDCSLALAGGVTVMSTARTFVEFSRQRGLAPDGRCQPFADAADGTGWGEGAGMLVLEQLSDARRNGHRVLAVVRGSALNQDGASNGLTAPNGPSQQRVIRQALADAGLSAADVDAVEAHGTGTPLGDPIEAQALLATYGQGRPADDPLWLGSVKSNIGHTQAAAGVAGVIKMVMAMRNGVLPKPCTSTSPPRTSTGRPGRSNCSPNRCPWPSADRPRRAGVSSFGISGTNAHVIIEQAPEAAPAPADEATPEPAAAPATALPSSVTAKSAAALRAQAGRLAEQVATGLGVRPADLGYSLATTRAAIDHRAAVLVADRHGRLLARARRAHRRTSHPRRAWSPAPPPAAPRWPSSFPGRARSGPAWRLSCWTPPPVFADRVRACAARSRPRRLVRCSPCCGEPTRPPWNGSTSSSRSCSRSWSRLPNCGVRHGVKPAAVVGHSQGEIAAACVAGALTLEDAARVVDAAQPGASRALTGPGGMVSVALPAEQVAERLRRWDGRLSVAAVNGAGSVVVSGDADALDELLDRAHGRGLRARRIAGRLRLALRRMWSPSSDELLDLLRDITPARLAHPVLLDGDRVHSSTPASSTPPTGTATCADRAVRGDDAGAARRRPQRRSSRRARTRC